MIQFLHIFVMLGPFSGEGLPNIHCATSGLSFSAQGFVAIPRLRVRSLGFVVPALLLQYNS
ncbi:MAG: hypothetical protein ABI785_10880 [Gemmatimonadales bacterium]